MTFFTTLVGLLAAGSVGGGGAPLTNLQAGRMGMDVGKSTPSSYSRIYLDYGRRASQSFLVPTTATPATLDGNGNPVGSYEVQLSGNPQANDLGVYNCWIDGQISGGGGAGLGIAKSSATVTTVVTFSVPVYTSIDNKTRFTMTIVSNGGVLGLVVSNLTASSYLRVIPATVNGVATTEAQSNDFHPDAITQMALGTTIRSLDWVQVNSTAETTWAGSIAAGGDGSVRGKALSLAEFCRFSRACGNADVWVNIPALATDAYVAQFLAVLEANLGATTKVHVEWVNEPWNPSFTGYSQLTYQANKLAGTFAGATARFATDANITSCVRASNVCTAVVSGAPFYTTSGHLIFVAGITSITGGLVTTTAVVNNGDGTWSLSWAETGADVTGTVINGGNNFNSYIHTNVDAGSVHYLCKPLTTYGQQLANTFVSPYVMKGRYLVERLRATYLQIQGLATASRFRPVMNNSVGGGTGNGLSENEAYPYAVERFGSHSWIYAIACAPYVANNLTSSATSTDQVFALLKTGVVTSLDILIQLVLKDGNAAASWGHPKIFYEGGPGTTVMGTAGAFIGAAHRDDRMRTDIILPLAQATRDFGGGLFCFYQGGSSGSFGAVDNSCWSMHEAGQITDFTTPKGRAWLEWGASSSVAAPRDGFTSGTINIPTVWAMSTGSGNANGCIVAGPTVAMGDCAIIVTKTVAGNYPLACYFCSSNAADYGSIFVNGVEVFHQQPLTQQNPVTAAPSTPFYNNPAQPMNAGANVVMFRPKPTGRSGFLGLNQVVSPDTPV